MMKLLDRYILKKVLVTFVYVVMLFVAIITIIDMTEKIDKFTKNNLGFPAILGYYADYVPWIAGLLTPIMAFIAVVYVTSRLAAHTEIIAMLSSGISFKRLLVPYLMAATVIASVSFYLNGWVIPKSNRERLFFEVNYLQNKKYTEDRHVHMQLQPNVYLYLQTYSTYSNSGYLFTLERFEDNRLIEKLTADHIQWDTTKRKWILKYWKHRFVDTLFQQTNKINPRSIRKQGDALDTLLAITPDDFENNSRKYDGMTIPELKEHIRKMKFRGNTGVEIFQTEEQIRYAAPFTLFILVLMGVIVSARKSRGGTGFQIALGFLLAFIFILFFTLTRTFSEAGNLSPVLAAWLPSLVFAGITAALYKYVPR